jgi:predicted DNA-binding protein (MmcQ/YjbR family)
MRFALCGLTFFCGSAALRGDKLMDGAIALASSTDPLRAAKMCITDDDIVLNSKSFEVKRMQSTNTLLGKLRKICLQLPGATETVTFEPPTFQAAGKTFAVWEEYKGDLGIALKVGQLMQGVFLKDPRFFLTPYAGKRGWVTLRVYAVPLNWEEIRELLQGSFHLVSRKKARPSGERV